MCVCVCVCVCACACVCVCSPCFNSQMFEKVLGNTDETDEQSPEAVEQGVYSTSLTDEQFLPTTETDENSHSALIQHLLSIIMVRFQHELYLKVSCCFCFLFVCCCYCCCCCCSCCCCCCVCVCVCVRAVFQ